MHLVTGLSYVLQQPQTAGLAKTKADTTNHSFCWSRLSPPYRNVPTNFQTVPPGLGSRQLAAVFPASGVTKYYIVSSRNSASCLRKNDNAFCLECLHFSISKLQRVETFFHTPVLSTIFIHSKSLRYFWNSVLYLMNLLKPRTTFFEKRCLSESCLFLGKKTAFTRHLTSKGASVVHYG